MGIDVVAVNHTADDPLPDIADRLDPNGAGGWKYVGFDDPQHLANNIRNAANVGAPIERLEIVGHGAPLEIVGISGVDVVPWGQKLLSDSGGKVTSATKIYLSGCNTGLWPFGGEHLLNIAEQMVLATDCTVYGAIGFLNDRTLAEDEPRSGTLKCQCHPFSSRQPDDGDTCGYPGATQSLVTGHDCFQLFNPWTVLRRRWLKWRTATVEVREPLPSQIRGQATDRVFKKIHKILTLPSVPPKEFDPKYELGPRTSRMSADATIILRNKRKLEIVANGRLIRDPATNAHWWVGKARPEVLHLMRLAWPIPAPDSYPVQIELGSRRGFVARVPAFGDAATGLGDTQERALKEARTKILRLQEVYRRECLPIPMP